MRIVDAEPEPKPQTQLFESKEIEFPVIPDKRRREAEGLLLDLNEVEQNHAKAELHKPDTDYQVTYLFEKEGCWKLHEIQDWSL